MDGYENREIHREGFIVLFFNDVFPGLVEVNLDFRLIHLLFLWLLYFFYIFKMFLTFWFVKKTGLKVSFAWHKIIYKSRGQKLKKVYIL